MSIPIAGQALYPMLENAGHAAIDVIAVEVKG